MATRQEITYLGQPLSLETGRIARQAHGAVVLQHGNLMILATAVSPDTRREGIDFFPLTVDYRERYTAVGKFPGGYIKRESRPTEKEILTMRCIDRPMRPLFPKGYLNEVQIMIQVLSADRHEDPDTMAVTAASAAVCISDIPFPGPMAAVRVSKVDGELKINVSSEERTRSTLDFVVAGTREKIVMIEGEAKEAPEDEVAEAICFGFEQLQPMITLQEELISKACKPKRSFTPVLPGERLTTTVQGLKDEVMQALQITAKTERNQLLAEIQEGFITRLGEDESFAAEDPATFPIAFDDLVGACMRSLILEKGVRVDGRGLEDIRPISCEVGILPRTHGDALFTRGETQSLAVTTLGTSDDAQKIELLSGETSKRFMLHYTFPPYSVGEARPVRGPGRREIGHGNLAERSLHPVVPDDFMYTIRITSDITESNGSSSMASVCGGCLALMDAGVPIKAPVAGISIGLIEQGDKQVLLTDIVGDEDHFGDMDFKVAGSRTGITGVQVDFKIDGLRPAVIAGILQRARTARLNILDTMAQTLAEPRPELSPFAPKILTVMIPIDKIGALIGPGGKNVRKIQEETGSSIAIEDDGTVQIAGESLEVAEAGKRMVEMCTATAEIGRIYEGPVTRLMNFGAFVKILPDIEGMVHISCISENRVENIEDVLHEGDMVKVRVSEIDDKGRVNLTMRGLDEPFDPSKVESRSSGSRNSGHSSDRRSRDRGHGSRDHNRR